MNRKLAPNFTQPKNLNIQFPKEIELNNGVQLFWMDDVKEDYVKLDIEWSAGSKYQTKKLAASFTNKLLLSGYPSKSAASIAEEVDYYGGFIQRELDRDHAGISIFGLTENIREVFKVFQDAFDNCTFPVDEFEKERIVSSSQFRVDAKKVKNLCRKNFNQAVFGEMSTYGQVAELSDYEALNVGDVRSFYETFYLKNKPTIFLVGNVSEDFIEQLKLWTAKMSFNSVPKKEKQIFSSFKGVKNETIDDAIQSAIRIGRIVMMKDHPDYFGFQVLNTILGGYFGSRLMLNIREDKGYTYGIGSAVSVMEEAAYFFISTEVAKEVKEDTINEVYKELNLLMTELVPDDELQRVKNYLLGDFLRQADGPMAMLENFKNIHFNNLRPSYYSDFIQAIHNLKAEDVMDLAKKYLQKNDLTVVTVG